MATWPTADRYPQTDDLLSPSSDGAAVTPSDTVALPIPSKRLWVGIGGSITLITVRGTTLAYTGIPSGVYLYVRAKQVMATGTTATNIIAEY